MIDWLINLITIDPLAYQSYEPSWWELILAFIFIFLMWKMIVSLFYIIKIQTLVIKEFINGWMNLFLRQKKKSQ